MNLKAAFIPILTLLGSAPAYAADQDTTIKAATVTRAAKTPTIDGVISEGEWSHATLIDDFHQTEPVQFGTPTERTEVFVTYDENYLYIAANLLHSEPDTVVAREYIQGKGFWSDDRISIVLDPFNTKRTGYEFMVNPNGLRFDGLFESASEFNGEWDGIWSAQSSTNSHGWQTEVAIPFKSLNFDPSNGTWGISFSRNIAHKRERLAWTSHNRRVNPSATGQISEIRNINQGLGLDISPSLTLKHDKDFQSSTGSTSSASPSLDLYYKITPSLNSSLTFNTDFSATDVDDRQVNLSRFSLFFPEKRRFFLQDSEAFRFGNIDENGSPFFSRRIGLSGDGTPIDLNVGLKVAGRIQDMNVGLLAVQQEEFGGLDKSNLLVGRASWNVFDESSVGLIVTQGDPRSNLDNSLFGFDYNYRSSELIADRIVESNIWYQKSDTENVADLEKAYGLRVNLPSRDGAYGWFSHTTIEDNFYPALGFVNRTGVRTTSTGGGYNFWPDISNIRQIEMSLSGEQTVDLDGNLESRQINFSALELFTDSGDHIWLSFNARTENLTQSFDILPGIIIPSGRYDFGLINVSYRGSSQRNFSPNLELSKGDFYSGTQQIIKTGFSVRPSEKLFLDVEYEQNDIKLPEGRFITRIVQGKANYAINAYWSWVNSVQFDNVSNQLGINSRLKWIREAGKEVTFVFERTLQRDLTNRFRTLNQGFVLKVGTIFRF